MSPSVIHKSFTIERTYPTTAERVFSALSEVEKKRRWFAEGEGFTVDSYELDFRVGGFERMRFRFGDSVPMSQDSVYLDIVRNARIVFAYNMKIGEVALSSSLSTVELEPVPSGTRMLFTEHTAFLDGKDGSAERREGSLGLFEALAKELATYA